MKNIKNMTAEKILDEAKYSGIPTDTESICEIQDVFGHTAIDELRELAKTKQNFYFVLFHIWNWEDAVRFYVNNSCVELEMMAKELNTAKNEKIALNRTIDALNEQLKEKDRKALEERNRTDAQYDMLIAEKDLEIVQLKAKLYDALCNA